MTIIRDFRYTDLDHLIALAQVAFAAYLEADGSSATAFAQQARALTRGRMVPLQLVTALMQRQWGITVAEHEGTLVGGSTYFGDQQRCLIANFMVHPAHRQQGIGQKLLHAQVARLQQHGCQSATATVRDTNIASLTAFQRVGFTEYSTTTEVEFPLPWAATPTPGLTVRTPNTSDRAALQALELRLLGDRVAVEGSRMDVLYPSLGRRGYQGLLQRRYRSYLVQRAVGEIMGFGFVFVEKAASKGFMTLISADSESAQALLAEAARWCTTLSKTALQVSLPGLTATGWVDMPVRRYIELLKRIK